MSFNPYGSFSIICYLIIQILKMDFKKEVQNLKKGVQNLKNQENAIRVILYDDNLSASEKIERIKALTTSEQMEENRTIVEKGKVIQKRLEEE